MPTSLKLNRWNGRLGNNIHQLQNAIQIALYNKYQRVIFPKHALFNTTCVNLMTDLCDDNDETVITDKDCFFYNRMENVDSNISEETIRIMRGIFRLSVGRLDDGNDLVIHLRGGDIFSKNPHQLYICPPLSYYISIINSRAFDKITIISEDRSNPAMNKLTMLYPEIELKIQSLEKDILILLGCRNVVESFGTFSPAILSLSTNVETIYRPSYQLPFLLQGKHVKVVGVELEEYKNMMTPWKNTKEQVKIMMEYQMDS